jgi:drug/metabolite transporter (DMT)-like permease
MRRPALVLVAVAVAWGSTGTVVRQVHLPAAAIVTGRVWIAALVLGVVLASGRVPGPRPFSVRPGRLVLVGCILAAHWLALFAAYQRAPVAWVILVVYLAPVLMTALAPRALGELHDRATIGALGVALAGFAVLARPGAAAAGTGPRVTGAGVALALLAMLSFAALVLLGKPLMVRYGGLRYSWCQLVVAGIVLLPFGVPALARRPDASWWWIVVLGVIHTAAAWGLYNAALARLPVARASVLTYLEPASAIVVAWIVLGERPSAATALGGALVIGAGMLVVGREARVSTSLDSGA